MRALRERFGVSRKLFSRAIGFSERAVADWGADKPLSDSSRQRMQEMSRLHAGLARVMKADFIGTWLTTPVEAFDGLKPLEVIERGEVDRIWRMIYQLESGIPTLAALRREKVLEKLPRSQHCPRNSTGLPVPAKQKPQRNDPFHQPAIPDACEPACGWPLLRDSKSQRTFV